jgi:hypothetical protein
MSARAPGQFFDLSSTFTTTSGQLSLDAPASEPFPNEFANNGNLGSFLLSGASANYTGDTLHFGDGDFPGEQLASN